MSLRDQTTLRIVLYEGAGAEPLPSSDRMAAITALLERGFSITRTTGRGGSPKPIRVRCWWSAVSQKESRLPMTLPKFPFVS